jgi:hypothetical protein
MDGKQTWWKGGVGLIWLRIDEYRVVINTVMKLGSQEHPEEEDTKIIRNVGKYSPKDTA